MLVNQPTAAPTRKVAAFAGGSFLGGPVLSAVARAFGIELDPEVAGALSTILGFATAYFTRERR